MPQEPQEPRQLTQGLDVVRDLAAQLRKVLVGHCQTHAHEFIQRLENELYSKVSRYCERHHALQLDCEPFCLKWRKEVVYQGTGAEEAIAHVLYGDDVTAIVFEHGITRDELVVFCKIWARGVKEHLGPTRSIATEVWEADLKHIRLRSRSLFDLVLFGDPSAARSLEEKMSAFSAWLSPDGEWRKTRRQDVLAHVVTENEDLNAALEVHRWDGLGDIDPQDLQATVRGFDLPRNYSDHDALADRCARLTLEANETVNYQRSALAKLVRVFWSLYAQPFRESKPKMQDAIRKAFDQMLTLGSVQDLADVLLAIKEEHDDLKAYEGFLEYFERPEVLNQLVAQLDDSELGARLVPLLADVATSSSTALFPHYKRLKTKTGRERLTQILVAKQPSPEAIVTHFDPSNNANVATCLELAQASDDPDAAKVRTAVLAQEQSALWLLALKYMPRKELLERKKELLERIPRADATYEKYLIRALVSEKDPNIVPYVEKKINTELLPMSERKRWVHALAAIGEEKAKTRLRRILGSSRVHIDLRVTAALVLGKLRDTESESVMLEITKKKFFGSRVLKDACNTALARMHAIDGSETPS